MKARHDHTGPLRITLRRIGGELLYNGSNQNESIATARKNGFDVVPGRKPTPGENVLSEEIRTGTRTEIYYYFQKQ